eukprot:m.734425 g.734425  ORF g.734425 m.734425 type:complete len:1002 (-) comp23084_c0_seq1:670-3675(-)
MEETPQELLEDAPDGQELSASGYFDKLRDGSAVSTSRTAPVGGWLKKLGAKGLIKKWRLRWFVLPADQNVVYYFRTPTSPLPLGEIDLADFDLWLTKDSVSGNINLQLGYFTLKSASGREYRLMAENSSTMQHWLGVLQDARKVEPSGGGPSSPSPFVSKDNVIGSHKPRDVHIPGPNDAVSSSDEDDPMDALDETPLPDDSPSPSTDFPTHTDSIPTHTDSIPASEPPASVEAHVDGPPPTARKIPYENPDKKELAVDYDDLESDSTRAHASVTSPLSAPRTPVEDSGCDSPGATKRSTIRGFFRRTARPKASKAHSSQYHTDTLRSPSPLPADSLSQSDPTEPPNKSQSGRRMENLETKVASLTCRLANTDSQLQAANDKVLDLQGEVAHLTQVLEARENGITIAVHGDKDQSFQVECLQNQNKFLNQELMDMKDKNALWKTRVTRLEAELERAKSDQMQLLQVLTESSNIDDLKTRATHVVEGSLQSNMSALSPRRSISRRQRGPAAASGGEGSAGAAPDGSSAIRYDQWGFPLTNDLAATYFTLKSQDSVAYKRSVRKWELVLSKYLGSPILPSAKDNSELKHLVRQGIPDALRARVWPMLIHTQIDDMRCQYPDNYYASLLDSNVGQQSQATKQIELDLMRTFPTHRDFRDADSHQIQALRRVLVAFSWHNAEIGYCQGVNMLAAVGLLHLNEEDAFWLLVCAVEKLLPDGYFTRGMEASQADQRVLQELLRERSPKIAAHLDKLEIDLSLVTFNWMLTVFVDCVPPPTMMRIWDVFLYEGSKIIMRICLGIFNMHHADILRVSDRQEVFELLRRLPKNLYDVHGLFKAAFTTLDGLTGFQSRAITEKRERMMESVLREAKEFEQRQKEFLKRRSSMKQNPHTSAGNVGRYTKPASRSSGDTTDQAIHSTHDMDVAGSAQGTTEPPADSGGVQPLLAENCDIQEHADAAGVAGSAETRSENGCSEQQQNPETGSESKETVDDEPPAEPANDGVGVE